MTMRIVYLQDHDGHKRGKEYRVERSLGMRLCENKIAEPLSVSLERKQAEADALEKARKKEEAEKKKAAELLKEKEAKAKETADSKPARTRSKSSKK